MTIPAVPESITRADYLRLVESVGLDPKQVRSLEFRVDGIYAVVKAKNPATGKEILDYSPVGGDELAVHRIYIPVVD